MKRTLAQKMLKALLARGYEHHTNARGGKYTELVPVCAVDKVERTLTIIKVKDGVLHTIMMPSGILFPRAHRLLVGSSGALRVTTGAIVDSRPVRDEYKKRLVQEGEAR